MWSVLGPPHANIDNPCDAARRFGIGGALMDGSPNDLPQSGRTHDSGRTIARYATVGCARETRDWVRPSLLPRLGFNGELLMFGETRTQREAVRGPDINGTRAYVIMGAPRRTGRAALWPRPGAGPMAGYIPTGLRKQGHAAVASERGGPDPGKASGPLSQLCAYGATGRFV